MSQLKNALEMKSIRDADEKLKAKERANFVPEESRAKPLAYFEISRYQTGPFLGLFRVVQLITEGRDGKKFKLPERLIVADGVDIVIAMANLETALRRRVFR
ncbi:MAG: hypothetical protein KGJ13_08475 [Patescibacteria group bacterium]|nr:hypothetical protein [Patescibacteria group bacterium]